MKIRNQEIRNKEETSLFVLWKLQEIKRNAFSWKLYDNKAKDLNEKCSVAVETQILEQNFQQKPKIRIDSQGTKLTLFCLKNI